MSKRRLCHLAAFLIAGKSTTGTATAVKKSCLSAGQARKQYLPLLAKIDHRRVETVIRIGLMKFAQVL